MNKVTNHEWDIVKDPEVAAALLLVGVKAGKDIDGDILQVQGHIIFVHILNDIVTEDISAGNRIGKFVWLWENCVDRDENLTDQDRIVIFADTLTEAQRAASLMSNCVTADNVQNIRKVNASDISSLSWNFTYLQA